MCEPTTIAIGLALAGGALSANATYQEGKNAKKASEANAKILDENAEIQRQQGKIEASKKRLDTKRTIARTNAIMASKGLDISSGNALDIVGDTAFYGELDAQTIEFNADNQVTSTLNQAEITRSQGRNAKSAGTAKAFGTLISSAGQAYGASNPGTAFSQTHGSQGASVSRMKSGQKIYWNN